MTSETSYDRARLMAGNLASFWNGGTPFLRRLAEAPGDGTISPWEALDRLGNDGFESLMQENDNKQHLARAFEELTGYLSAETWFDRAKGSDERLSFLENHPVAYFSAEFGLASWLPIYSGGLGILAGDFLKEASDMGVPMVGVGLFYRHGFFSQHLDESSYQTEIVPSLDPANLPLEIVEHSGEELRVTVPIEDRQVQLRVWRLNAGRVPLYLLDTNVAENGQEDRTITDRLYLGGEEVRIRQEIVLGIGGVRMLRALKIEPAVYSMNEGHSAFLGLELLAERIDGRNLDDVLPVVRSMIVYTNHTVVPAGNDVFPRELVTRYLEPFAEETEIGMAQLLSLGTPGSDSGFSMAVLAFQLSGKANAVSRLHAQVIPREWPGFPIEAVTNGVHVPTWLGAPMVALLDEYVPHWRGDSPDWERIHDIPDARLMSARECQRRQLIDLANRRHAVTLDPKALTIVWARRFAEYKRANLITSDLGRLTRILSNPDRPVQLIIAGKSHPLDEGGKRMLQNLLHTVQQDSTVASRVAFLEDYDIDLAGYLAAGADVWLNTPRKPLEASGTSGMKSSDNGGLQLTVTDGWADEVDWWGIGWGIPGEGDEADARTLYTYLEDGVIPTFYRRDESGISADWLAMVKRTMILTLRSYSTRRMLHEYLDKLYLPLVASGTR